MKSFLHTFSLSLSLVLFRSHNFTILINEPSIIRYSFAARRANCYENAPDVFCRSVSRADRWEWFAHIGNFARYIKRAYKHVWRCAYSTAERSLTSVWRSRATLTVVCGQDFIVTRPGYRARIMRERCCTIARSSPRIHTAWTRDATH